METIFVSIASFRDPECQWTVKDLFEKANDPSRVYVGICWQYDKENSEDSNCFLEKYPFPKQVRSPFYYHIIFSELLSYIGGKPKAQYMQDI